MDLFRNEYSRTKCSCFLLGHKGSGFLGTTITGGVHGLRLFEMQPTFSSSHISSLNNF